VSDNNSIFGQDALGEFSDVSLELERIKTLSDGVAKSLTTAFRSAAIEGKSLRSVLSDIGRSFADIALKAALKPFGDLVSGLVENVFSATNPLLNQKAFARGGVISSPQYFSLGGNNIGLAGEAGAEAILPLARGSDGRLGVSTNAAPAMTINFQVTASDARSFVGAEAEISAMLLRAVKRGRRAS